MKADPSLEDFRKALPQRPQRNVTPREQLQIGATAMNVALPTVVSQYSPGALTKLKRKARE